ncbi:hypothetical protein KG088_12745 [Halomonas sp. TRM85114]|uniref:hypothetical protein n=1 Tax=Halomonas jincaotanensis TaxID=2810616 RepID=UPI001BD65FCD|nr:hypothetical protein [Halomonas jincaotanensis]MBS9404499.1 hypothetical protein [Halomonas jincaotanensis]
MDIIRQISLSFPLVVFTALLALALVYWLLVALHLASVELFEHDSLKHDHMASTLVTLGFAGVPASFALTVLFLVAGSITLALELLILRWLPLGLFRIPVGIVVLWGAFALASPLSAALCHSLHGRFHRRPQLSRRCLLGERVVVTCEADSQGFASAVLADDVGCEVRLHGKQGAMPVEGERRVLVKYLPGERAYRSVAEADYLDARTRLSRLRLVQKHQGPHSLNGGPAASH